MTVIERLYDNAWFVANAAPAAREELAAAVTKAWMDRESAAEDAYRARSVANLVPARSALALSLGNAAQAGYDRARARDAAAARCTDIIAGHAFSVTRTPGPDGAMTVEVASCTLARHATLRVTGRGEQWSAVLFDPASRQRDRFTTVLGADPWEALHWACEWITTEA